MTDVKIRAKGCAATGITDELATKLYNNKGTRLMAIVELKVERTSEDADGDRSVDLTIQELEPVVDGKLNGALDEHVRTIQQALYRNRALADGQEQLEYGDGPEPTVAEVLQQGAGLLERGEDGEVTGLWDGDTDDETDDEDQEPANDEVDPYTYIHTAQHAAPGADTACGLRATFNKSLNTHQDQGKVTCPECLSALDATWDDDEEPPTDDDQDDAGTVLAFSGKDNQ